MRVFIGMPVYNGGKYIELALSSLCQQQFKDWHLLISDNASTDNTGEICRKYTNLDQRIKYVRQEKNTGMAANFKFVLDAAHGDSFMWAAADDVWDSAFIASCVNYLEKNARTSFVFCEAAIIDTFGRKVCQFPPFSTFEGKFSALVYLKQPVFMGHSHSIYGLFRLSFIRKVWQASPFTLRRASDVAFMYAAHLRGSFKAIPSILFYKRWPRVTDCYERVDHYVFDKEYYDTLPFHEYKKFTIDMIRASKNTPYYLPTVVAMGLGIPRSICKDIKARTGAVKNELYKRLLPKLR